MNHLYFTYTEEEIKEIVLRIYPRAIAYIRSMLGSRNLSLEAEDIFQDVLCKFMERRVNILSSKVPAYLYKMIRNAAINVLTRNKLDLQSIRVDEQVASSLDRLAQAEYREDTDSYDIDSIAIEDILGFSDSFSPRMRGIFYLSRVKGCTHREIAEQLGISVRAVEKYLSQSVSLYRQYFGYGRDNDIIS